MAEQTPRTQTYAALLANIKERIQTAQVRAAVAVNQELVILYWGIGREILSRQQQEGWGAKIIDQLAKDLRRTDERFPPDVRRLKPTSKMASPRWAANSAASSARTFWNICEIRYAY